MKRVRRSKALSILLTVCMLLGLLPVNMLGRAVEVQAAESSAAKYVKYDVGEWTASSDGKSETRTTTWDFTKDQPSSSTTIAVGDTLKGIVINGGTVAYKGLSSSGAVQGFSLGQNASVTIPLDAATASVTIEFQLTSNTKTRSITIGNDSKSETVSHNASATEGAHINNDKIFSGTYDSGFFTEATLKLTSNDTPAPGKNPGDSKFGYIKITETRPKTGGESDNGGNTGNAGEGDEGGSEKKYLTLNGEEVKYDFRESSFGAYSDADGSYTTDDGILTITGAISCNGSQHGANVGNGNVFTVNAPAGKTVITLSGCAYGSSTATLQVNGTAVGDAVSIGQFSSDGTEVTFEYTSDTEVKLGIAISGSGYLHYMKAKTVTSENGGEGDNPQIDKKYLTLDGEEVTYDLRTSSFDAYGKDESATWTHTDGILSINGSISHNGSQHGANIFDGTKFAVNAPAGKTTITLGTCQYGSSSAALYVDGEQVGDTVSIGGLTADTLETVFTYTAEEDKTISIVISGGGYLHYLKAKSETPPSTYTLSGSITGLNADELVALSALNFTALTDSDYDVPAAKIDAAVGTYSIELAKGVE